MKFALSKIKRADLTAHGAARVIGANEGRNGNSSYIAADPTVAVGQAGHGSGATIYRTKSNPEPADSAEIELINTSWEDWRNLQFKNIHTLAHALSLSLSVIKNGTDGRFKMRGSSGQRSRWILCFSRAQINRSHEFISPNSGSRAT